MTTTKTRKGHERQKRMLKAKGWSYRTAAPVLEVNYSHLSQVLNGHRQSRSLLQRIEALPQKEEVSK